MVSTMMPMRPRRAYPTIREDRIVGAGQLGDQKVEEEENRCDDEDADACPM